MSAGPSFSLTRLSMAPSDCRIDGIPTKKLSRSINDEDGVVIPIQAYLLENAIRIGDAWRTTEKEGHILNQWYDYLRLKKVPIFEADERHLRNFLLGGGQRAGNVVSLDKNSAVVRTETNLHKFRVIVSFYDFWQNRRGQKLRSFRGITLAEIKETLLPRPHRSLAKAEINFSRSGAAKPKKRLGTPSPEESAEILTKALDQYDQNRAHTYYLIGCLARYSGSRGVGISGLLVPQLFNSLKKEAAFRKIENYTAVLDGHLRAENKFIILQTLQHMRDDHRTFIYCEVTNKGGDWTTIAIPIELCEEIVDYICTTRQELVEARFLKKNKKPPPNVFLSYKNGALSQEAMGNFYNKIFKELEINGTFHRFRAAFCQEVVRDIYMRERAINGSSWQSNNVLEFARKLLGHKNPKSLQHYLDHVQAQEVSVGHPVMVTSSEDANYVRAVAAHLDAPDSDDFRTALHLFLGELGIEPISDEGRRYALF
ncbi:site-specific integrase [Aminobacter sp. AP02]|uniref:site-specific integrase n=1 Tax=Aminobacter sp. AP02 TaxID=2135737 RepID=UPI000D6C11D8|nr:site-specific integrase [Aminobacter sp. AP02]PWK56693.1 hypothetical protein C8K44_1562 [Aminobacter sp. AP02]